MNFPGKNPPRLPSWQTYKWKNYKKQQQYWKICKRMSHFIHVYPRGKIGIECNSLQKQNNTSPFRYIQAWNLKNWVSWISIIAEIITTATIRIRRKYSIHRQNNSKKIFNPKTKQFISWLMTSNHFTWNMTNYLQNMGVSKLRRIVGSLNTTAFRNWQKRNSKKPKPIWWSLNLSNKKTNDELKRVNKVTQNFQNKVNALRPNKTYASAVVEQTANERSI